MIRMPNWMIDWILHSETAKDVVLFPAGEYEEPEEPDRPANPPTSDASG